MCRKDFLPKPGFEPSTSGQWRLPPASCFFCRYKSQHARQVREEFNAGKMLHRTMGEANVDLMPPEEFLRKKTRENKFAQRAKSARVHRKLVFKLLKNLTDRIKRFLELFILNYSLKKKREVFINDLQNEVR